MAAGMKVDNSSLELKIKIRRQCREWIKAPHRVLDLYAGFGNIQKAAFPDVDYYLGIEQRRECARGGVWIGDNRKLLPRALTKAKFNIFDLDAYGYPWPLMRDLVAQLPPGRVAFSVTCGMLRDLVSAGLSKEVRRVTHWPLTVGLGLVNWYDDIVRWFLADMPKLKVEKCLRAAPRKRARSVVYYAILATIKAAPGARTPGAASTATAS